jgi:4-amino-4-deoxy-L-arabinose transferase-like glycosyltransferase
MKSTIIILAAIILLVLTIRTPMLGIPFERDEGEYAYIAWRLEYGELPYRDWVDQKPPAIFWIYRLALKLPLDSIRSVHLMALFFSAASACSLYFLSLHFLKRFWAVIASILFVLLTADPLVQGTASNTELFMLFPLILSLVALLASHSALRGRILLAILAGIFTGIAIAFKQVALVNWPLLVAGYWLYASGPKKLHRSMWFAAWSAVGAASVMALIGGYFAYRNGLNDLVYNVITHNLEYIRSIPWNVRLTYCLRRLSIISRSEILVWCSSIAGFAMLWKSGMKKNFFFLLGWLLASAAGVSASGYYFQHYFLQWVPVLCITAAIGAEKLEHASFWRTTPMPNRQAILCAMLMILPCIVLFPYTAVYSPKDAVREIYPDNSFFAEMPELGQHIDQITRPDDRLFIFGAEPELLFYSRRVSATRYIFLFPLYGPYSDAPTRQVETAREVSGNHPAAALYLASQLFFVPGTDQYFTNWSEAYLRDQFHADCYLVSDRENIVHFLPGAEALPPDSEDQRFVGMFSMRNAK